MVYLRQEGRGIGLINKLKAYSLQDGGLDTVEANEKLGFPADLRNYGVGAQILSDLGIHRLRLLTNNPRKIAGLGGYGLEVVDRVPLVIHPGDHNAEYLAAKRDKLGHLIQSAADPSPGLADGDLQSSATVISWDGVQDQLPLIRARSESAATRLQLKLQVSSSPRLLALWERPQFAWRVVDQQPMTSESSFATRVQELLETLASWEETRRLGLYVAASKAQVEHPPQTINRNELSLLALRSGEAQLQGRLSQPTLQQWS